MQRNVCYQILEYGILNNILIFFFFFQRYMTTSFKLFFPENRHFAQRLSIIYRYNSLFPLFNGFSKFI